MNMTKKTLTILLSLALMTGLFTACGGGGQADPAAPAAQNEQGADSPAPAAPSGTVQEVLLYNNKIEIADALNAMADFYNANNTGVRLRVETTGSDDYATALKTRFTSGDEPDLFVITGTEQMMLWLEYMENLNDQPWVPDMVDVAKPGVTYEGSIYAFPVGIEGYGYMYNKDLFNEAGIDKVPVTADELRAAADKLRAIGVEYPFVNTFGEWYQSGMFYFNAPLAVQPDPYAFIDGLNNGTNSIPETEAFAGLLDMIDIDYSGCENPLNTDFSAQVSRFGSGASAIATGGTWNQPTLNDANPGMNVGLMPMPITSNAADNDVLYAGVTNYWAVNKNSPAKDAAKEFLNWLVSNADGQRYLTTEILNIPAFKNVPADNEAVGPLGQALVEYLAAGKTRGIYNSLYTFSATEAFGTTLQKYAAGQIDRAQCLQELQAAWDDNKSR